MTDKMSCIAVDVGNSAIKVLVLTASNQLRRLTVRLESADWLEQVLDWVGGQHDVAGCEWRVSSVHRAAAERLQTAVVQRERLGSVRRVSHADVPMISLLQQPTALGIDRLLGGWSAYQEFRGELIVVDAGSAITVDRVSADGQFLGGAILPGLNLQIEALATGTDALPAIKLEPGTPLEIPATTTGNAIRLGVVAGAAGAIDRLVQLYLRQGSRVSGNGRVVLTGGDAELLSGQLSSEHVLRPDLICRGLLDLPRSEEPSAPAAARSRQ